VVKIAKIKIQAVARNEPATGRGLDWKVKHWREEAASIRRKQYKNVVSQSVFCVLQG
jgi:hypothetical protein